MCVSLFVCSSVVPRYRVDDCRDRHRLFLVLPGGKELQDHGVFQEHGPSGTYTAGHKNTHKILLCITSAQQMLTDFDRKKLVCSVLHKLSIQYD